MTTPEYGRLSPFRDPAAMSEAKARDLTAALERRAASADEVAARAAYLDLLEIAPGERVLEVGCGSGAVLREVARRVEPSGRAVGVDPSAAFLMIARELAEQAGLGDRIELREGDARSLPFGEGELDAVLAVTVLSHVPEGERAVPELVRVVRPGGRVGVFDRDNDSFIISHPDRAMTRRIVAAGSDHAAVDSWLGRRLPRLLSQAGLRDVRVRAFASVEQDSTGFYATQARQRAEIALKAGLLSDQECRRWLDELEAEQAAGGSLAGLTQLFVWGTRPPEA